MEKIVIYGKGGIGKSTIAANLSATWARRGKKVLHVGCDPKHDSSVALTGTRRMSTVIERLFGTPGEDIAIEDILMPGRYGIDCIESGGPEPGVGCGGRSITRMLEAFEDLDLFHEKNYDIALFDVLGDVVCGGFAAPLRSGYANKIFVVTSEEAMALYAANNICKAVRRFRPNGVALGGLIANLRDSTDASIVEDFARRVGTQVVAVIPRDPVFRIAEKKKAPLAEVAPDSPLLAVFEQMASFILDLNPDQCPSPTPLDEAAFDAFVEETFPE